MAGWTKLGLEDCGCFGDGALGHEHTRRRCADALAAFCAMAGHQDEVRALSAALRDDMSDDAHEEDEACELLEQCVPVEGASWGWRDGDFGLWPIESE